MNNVDYRVNICLQTKIAKIQVKTKAQYAYHHRINTT